MKYRVFHTNYPLNVVEQSFVITIIRSCENPKSLFPTVLVDHEYTLTKALKTYAVPAFSYTPTFCDLVYSFTVTGPDG